MYLKKQGDLHRTILPFDQPPSHKIEKYFETYRIKTWTPVLWCQKAHSRIYFACSDEKLPL